MMKSYDKNMFNSYHLQPVKSNSKLKINLLNNLQVTMLFLHIMLNSLKNNKLGKILNTFYNPRAVLPDKILFFKLMIKNKKNHFCFATND